MKLSSALYRRLRWVHIPTGLLVTLLQRNPIVQVAQLAEEMISDSPIAAILKSTVAASAALGAMNTLAGATTLNTNVPSPLNGVVGTAIQPVAFDVLGTTSPAGSWQVTSSLPAGLTITDNPNTPSQTLTGAGIINAANPILSGTPTAAGTYNITLIAWENANAGGIESPTYTYTVIIGGSAGAPSFSTVPQSTSGQAGTAVTLTAAASGSPTYQWYKNGASVSGATSASYAISSPAKSDSGSYYVVATNGSGATTSSTAVLTIYAATDAPVFSFAPIPQTVSQGLQVSFGATAVGPGSISYQWNKNGAPISGQTSNSLVITNAQMGDQAAYSVTATNGNGGTTSASVNLTVQTAAGPVITTQPVSQTAVAGSNVTFSVVATNAIDYQWFKNGSAISGATQASYTINSVSAPGGTYYVAVDNFQMMDDGYGNVTTTGAKTQSNNAILTVTSSAAPSFTTQPTSQTVSAGATVTFTAAASNSPTYQWEFNGVAINGQTGASLTLTNVTAAANTGTYTVVATNSGGSITSTAATLTVGASSPAPAFTTQPLSLTVNAGGNASFTVVATNATSYQWFLGTNSLSGQTTATLTLTAVTSANAGSYTVQATGPGGTTTSSAAALTVNTATAAPTTASPVAQSMATGSTVVLTGAATGATSYQWNLNGSLVSNSATISGATTARLVISNSGSANAGSYTLTATNGSGSATSTAATVGVAAASSPGRLVNLSILSTINGTLTMGFVNGGSGTTGSEPLLIRAIGPSIGPGTLFNVSGVMSDPTLSVVQTIGGANVASNTGWGSNATAVMAADTSTGAFPLTVTTSLDSAVVANLTPVGGGFGAQVKGQSGDGGFALTEVYDNTVSYTAASPRLVNLSCLTNIAPGGTLSVGFVLGGTTSKTVLVRVSGPSIAVAPFNIGGTMPDPQLSLVQGSKTLATNAGWGGDATIASTAASLGAFAFANSSTKDSAVLITVPPVSGGYSVTVSSVSNAGGTVLVEVYEVP